jgi:O-antigen ligase
VGGAPNSGNTLAWRLSYWTEVLPLANRNPVTGIGLNMTQYNTDKAKQPHNDFIRAYVETGLVGFIAYLSMMIALIGMGRRAVRTVTEPGLDRGVAIGFLGCAVAFLAVSFVANVISNVVNLWYFFTFAAAASAIVNRRSVTLVRSGLTPSAHSGGTEGPHPPAPVGGL